MRSGRLFLCLRLLAGPGQRDHLRCSRLVVVDDQRSGLLHGIRRTEGHQNFTALSRLQRHDACAAYREWRVRRLVADRYRNRRFLGAAVLDRHRLGLADRIDGSRCVDRLFGFPLFYRIGLSSITCKRVFATSVGRTGSAATYTGTASCHGIGPRVRGSSRSH